MDDRQSDNFIVLMMMGNAIGGKGVACGNIYRGNLPNTQRLKRWEYEFCEER